MKKLIIYFIFVIFLNGCSTDIARQDCIDSQNNKIGYKVPLNIKPFKYDYAGKMFRADFVKSSVGIVNITKNENGNLILHWKGQEVLGDKNYHRVGICLTYQEVDSKTGVILKWGFDKGGNPKSCVAWWP